MDRFLIKKPRTEKEVEVIDEIDEEASLEVEQNNDENQTPKRSRKFREEWLKQFSWLENKSGKAFCKACEKNIIHILPHLKRHEECSSHCENVKSKRKQAMLDCYLDKEKEEIGKMVKHAEFTMVMFLIAHNLPFLLMDSLPELLAECCPDSKVAKRLKCARTKATQITEEISNVTSKALISTLKNCKFSIIIDETTDVSATKCLVLVVRFVANFIIRDRFLALIELPQCDAGSVFNVVKKIFYDNSIPLNNIIGLATDGASVMAGHLSGVKALFEAETNIFYLKCTCHSLHLCVSYACKKLPRDVEWLSRNIYSFFSHSPKRVHDLQEFQDYCSVKPHKILGICQTRWLSLEGVVSRIIEQWDCLKLFFISSKLEVNAVRSDQLAEKMNNRSKAYFLFLSYFLPIINNLNKDFQSEKSRLPYLYSNIKSHFLLILSNFIKENIQLHVDIDYKNVTNYRQVSKIFIGAKAELFFKNSKATSEEITEIKKYILKFYIEILDQLKLRFDFTRKDLELLKIITPPEVLSNNGSSIWDLIEQFQDLCNVDSDKVISQWVLLKLSDHNLKGDIDIDSFWGKSSLH